MACRRRGHYCRRPPALSSSFNVSISALAEFSISFEGDMFD